MSEQLIEQLHKEAARNAQMQGDKEHQTNRRRKTFRGRNRLFTKAADRIVKLEASRRKDCIEFFQWWWNQPGTNIEQGYDAWLKMKAQVERIRKQDKKWNSHV